MDTERHILGAIDDLGEKQNIILRLVKEMQDTGLVAAVQRIEEGVKQLNGTVSNHEEQLHEQKVINATTTMLINQVAKDQKKQAEQINWAVRIIIGAVIAQVLVQIFIK